MVVWDFFHQQYGRWKLEDVTFAFPFQSGPPFYQLDMLPFGVEGIQVPGFIHQQNDLSGTLGVVPLIINPNTPLIAGIYWVYPLLKGSLGDETARNS